MAFYVIQVQPRNEGDYVSNARRKLSESDGRLHWPRRNLRIRRRGIWHDSTAPVFPGYVFLEAIQLSPPLFALLKSVPGFHRFLKSNRDIVPLTGADEAILLHFLSFGEIVGRSQVRFADRNRVVVLSGPLTGLEGKIVKIDRRKGRARVNLDLYDSPFVIDFGFDDLGAVNREGDSNRQ